MAEEKLLSNLTDYEKALLTRFSYINYNIEDYSTLDNSTTITGLTEYMNNPNSPYLRGTAGIAGITTTPAELMEEMARLGLGDFKIKSIENCTEKKLFAIAIEDSQGNTGIIYRGSDANIDWKDNIHEFLFDDSNQIGKARDFFENNKNENGNNYLFGHSLGGGLVSHIYSESYDEIENAFSINAPPINPQLLRGNENRIAAFNNSEKYQPVIIGGDIVGILKDTSMYDNNIRYVVNNGELDNGNITGFFTPHAMEAARYNDDGSFDKASREEVYSSYTEQATAESRLARTHNVTSTIVEIIPEIRDRFMGSEAYENSKLPKEEVETEKIGIFRRIGNFMKRAIPIVIRRIFQSQDSANRNLPSSTEEIMSEIEQEDLTSQVDATGFKDNIKLENFDTECKVYDAEASKAKLADREKLLEEMEQNYGEKTGDTDTRTCKN